MPSTPEKKRVAKLAVKEEQKSSGKKMGDKDFKKFLEQCQDAAVSDAPMPLMKDKSAATTRSKADVSSMAGSKRSATRAALSGKASAVASIQKRSKR